MATWGDDRGGILSNFKHLLHCIHCYNTVPSSFVPELTELDIRLSSVCDRPYADSDFPAKKSSSRWRFLLCGDLDTLSVRFCIVLMTTSVAQGVLQTVSEAINSLICGDSTDMTANSKLVLCGASSYGFQINSDSQRSPKHFRISQS